MYQKIHQTTRIPNSSPLLVTKTVTWRYFGNREWYHRSAGVKTTEKIPETKITTSSPLIMPSLAGRCTTYDKRLTVCLGGDQVDTIFVFQWSPAPTKLFCGSRQHLGNRGGSTSPSRLLKLKLFPIDILTKVLLTEQTEQWSKGRKDILNKKSERVQV